MIVSDLIGPWYDKNKRYLPWREDKNPYSIWLSEIILQQTRVQQGLPYYYRFLKVFPVVTKLASASIEEVLMLWQGLGYYTRARNLHKAAQAIVKDFGGEFPDTYLSIRNLPGVGDYTAAAIASLAFDLPYAAVDGNVYRVLARYLGIDHPVNSSAGKKKFASAAAGLLDKANPGRHNQAMIELGALICLPKNPLCEECPLKDSCYALKENAINRLPVKQNKPVVTHRYFYYLVIRSEGRLYLHQRKEGDIWALLYDFPLIELKQEKTLEDLLQDNAWKAIFGSETVIIRKLSGEYRHVLSHQILHARFIQVETMGTYKHPGSFQIADSQLRDYPLPRLINKYLDEEKAFH